MTFKGIAKGKTIELDKPLPYPSGQQVSVSIEPVADQRETESAAALREAMHEPPHLASEAVDELLKAIAEGKLPVRSAGVFE